MAGVGSVPGLRWEYRCRSSSSAGSSSGPQTTTNGWRSRLAAGSPALSRSTRGGWPSQPVRSCARRQCPANPSESASLPLARSMCQAFVAKVQSYLMLRGSRDDTDLARRQHGSSVTSHGPADSFTGVRDEDGCDICHSNDWDAICEECGRHVCPGCFNPHRELCIFCAEFPQPPPPKRPRPARQARSHQSTRFVHFAFARRPWQVFVAHCHSLRHRLQLR